MQFIEFVLYTWIIGMLFTAGAAGAVKDDKLNSGEMLFISFLWPVCLGVGFVQLMVAVNE